MSDHFDRLGQPKRYSVDLSAIEREYLSRSRQVHPDHHAGDERKSLDESAELNKAYQTLTDPFRRAEYYLSLLGGPSAREQKAQDQAFLMEMMELRERFEGVAGQSEEIAKAEVELEGRLNQVLDHVSRLFGRIDTSGSANPADLLAIRKQLNAAKTLQSLHRGLTDPGID